MVFPVPVSCSIDAGPHIQVGDYYLQVSWVLVHDHEQDGQALLQMNVSDNMHLLPMDDCSIQKHLCPNHHIQKVTVSSCTILLQRILLTTM